MKKRYIVYAGLIVLLLQSIIPAIAPVLPVIQLPGEVYIGTDKWPIIGDFFGGFTNLRLGDLIHAGCKDSGDRVVSRSSEPFPPFGHSLDEIESVVANSVKKPKESHKKRRSRRLVHQVWEVQFD